MAVEVDDFPASRRSGVLAECGRDETCSTPDEDDDVARLPLPPRTPAPPLPPPPLPSVGPVVASASDGRDPYRPGPLDSAEANTRTTSDAPAAPSAPSSPSRPTERPVRGRLDDLARFAPASAEPRRPLRLLLARVDDEDEEALAEAVVAGRGGTPDDALVPPPLLPPSSRGRLALRARPALPPAAAALFSLRARPTAVRSPVDDDEEPGRDRDRPAELTDRPLFGLEPPAPPPTLRSPTDFGRSKSPPTELDPSRSRRAGSRDASGKSAAEPVRERCRTSPARSERKSSDDALYPFSSAPPLSLMARAATGAIAIAVPPSVGAALPGAPPLDEGGWGICRTAVDTAVPSKATSTAVAVPAAPDASFCPPPAAAAAAADAAAPAEADAEFFLPPDPPRFERGGSGARWCCEGCW